MDINKLNENPIVFYKSVMKTLLKPEEMVLGTVQYANSYSKAPSFIANIVYVNDDGVIMLANDYFYNKGIKSFTEQDGVSAGYMIDNWSPQDNVQYQERQAPKDFATKLKSIDFKNAGYSRQEFITHIESLMDKVWETNGEDSKVVLDLGQNLAKFYIQSRYGDPLTGKEYEKNIDESIPFRNEDEALRSLFPLKEGGLVCKIRILDSEEHGMNIELESEDKKELTLDALSVEGLGELVDFLIEQSFYGATKEI